ncbi:MAG: DpnI domain-containing protein [Candidatus Acidiferrales bacterium]
MNLQMDHACAESYRSRSQAARMVTELWGSQQLYCASCTSPVLERASNNTKAFDFSCPGCSAFYQLKSSKAWNESRIVDAGYHAMMTAIMEDRTPNLLILNYTLNWSVLNLLLVPSFFFSPAAVEKRKPLAPSARRAGWIGCNIRLDAIAPEGKLRIVQNGIECAQADVRHRYAAVRPLAALPVSVRGWALDVLKVVRQIGKSEFNLDDAYRFEDDLRRLHPQNRNVRPKIRQQLQVLRDIGIVKFVSPGRYRIVV